MMARSQTQRPSTLIDPSSLNQRPSSQILLAGSDARLSRSGSLGGKPLLNFDEDRSPELQTSLSGGRKAIRSVFGTDTLWEREMAKLKEIEAQEAEEQRRQEAAEAKQAEKKSKKKGKRKEKEKGILQDVHVEEPEPRTPVEVPAPSVIQRPIARTAPPPPGDGETESSSEPSDVDTPRRPSPKANADGWHSGESGKEVDGPVRTTGVGPRYPKRTRTRRRAPAVQSATQSADDDDSEEDMPLAATVSRAVQRATRLGFPASTEQSDSDEEMPLSQLLTKSKYAASVDADADKANYLNVSATPGHVEDEDEDEDNEPLGLRVSRFISSQSQFGNADDEDDDDRPLGLHPEHQRRTQYSMFLQQQQQQQQQQQLLLQAQMQQSIMFSPPSMIGSAFFGAPVMPQMMPMMPPPASASPPPGAPDMTKFGRVDRWRHEIVGGQP